MTDAERTMKLEVLLGNGDVDIDSPTERMLQSLVRDLTPMPTLAAAA